MHCISVAVIDATEFCANMAPRHMHGLLLKGMHWNHRNRLAASGTKRSRSNTSRSSQHHQLAEHKQRQKDDITDFDTVARGINASGRLQHDIVLAAAFASRRSAGCNWSQPAFFMVPVLHTLQPINSRGRIVCRHGRG
jgi:Flp pilus assembly protein TadB